MKQTTTNAKDAAVARVLKSKQGMADIQDEEFWKLALKCTPYSLLTPEKFYNLYETINYIVSAKVPGDIVECGVWHGGAMMMTAYILGSHGVSDRDIYLYDTFSGFTERSEHDMRFDGRPLGAPKYANFKARVEANLAQTGYPSKRIHLVEGDVHDTVRSERHEAIAMLRLDTDTYSSTLHELNQLYRRVVQGGVICIDDYGYSFGCRKAFHEFFDGRDRLLWQRPNRSARTAVKLTA